MQKIKRLFQYLFTIMMPWISLLVIEQAIPAFIVFLLQISVVGWIPGSIWACILLKKHFNQKASSSPQDKNE